MMLHSYHQTVVAVEHEPYSGLSDPFMSNNSSIDSHAITNPIVHLLVSLSFEIIVDFVYWICIITVRVAKFSATSSAFS